MSKRSCLAILLAASTAAVQADTPDVIAAKAMDALLAVHHKADAPGCSAGVYRGATLLHAGGFGMSNLELGVPITPASAFDIGSTSKQFTALSALMLAREGKLSLDEPIRKHVPELPAHAADITLRQLLNHTSGIRDYIDLLRMSGAHEDDVTTTRRALHLLSLQQGTHFAPGTRYEYSNSGYLLVAIAVERVSGQSLREFADQRLFAPLGMRHTLYRDDHAELVPQRAMAYASDDKKGWRLDVSNWEQMGDGGILTTVLDLAAWNGNFSEPTVADALLLDQLHERGILADGSRIPYALGLIHGTYRGHAKVEHGGTWGGYISNFVRYPRQGLGVAVLCNSPDQPMTALIEQISDLYLPPGSPPAVGKAGARQPMAAPSADQLQQWLGTYRPAGAGDVLTLRLKAGALEAEHEGTTYSLQPAGDRAMQVAGIPVEVLLTLEPASEARPRRLRQSIDGVDQDPLIAFEAATGTPAQLQPLAGFYYCPEIEAGYRINAQGSELIAVSPRGDVIKLTQREQGYFVGGGRVLQFMPAKGAAAPTLQLGATRARGLQCERRASAAPVDQAPAPEPGLQAVEHLKGDAGDYRV